MNKHANVALDFLADHIHNILQQSEKARHLLFLRLTLATSFLTLLLVFVNHQQPLTGSIIQPRRDPFTLGLLRGRASTEIYRSFDSPVVDVEFLGRDASCGQEPFFFAPSGPGALGDEGGVILGADGELVWRQDGSGSGQGQVEDFRVQEYRGEKFLTFWQGVVADGVRKEGSWYMVSFLISDAYDNLPFSLCF
jgi:hypothetical protein